MLAKKEQSCLKKYGVCHPMQTPLTKENHKNACLSKYGVTHYSKTKEFSDKMKSLWTPEKLALRSEKTKQTCLLKYGVDNPAKLTKIIKKIKDTKIKRYNNVNYNNRQQAMDSCMSNLGVKYPTQNKEIQSRVTASRTKNFIESLFDGTRLNGKIIPLFNPTDLKSAQDIYPFQCVKCKTTFNSNIEDGKVPKCPACFPRNNISLPEIEFLDHLHITERQTYIKPYKVDGIKGNKIFEFLGDYWHGNPKIFLSEDINLSNNTSFGELYTKTMAKFVSLKQMGYDIYYIWEHKWNAWNRNKSIPFPIKRFKLEQTI